MSKVKTSLFVILLLALMFIVSSAVAGAGLYFWHKDKIMSGVTVNGIAVGGLTPKEALDRLRKSLPWPGADSVFALTGPDGTSRNIKYGDIHLTADYRATVDEAMGLGKNAGSPGSLYSLVFKGADIPLKVNYDEAAFRNILKEISANYYRPEQKVQILAASPENITLRQGTPEMVLDLEAAVQELHRLNSRQYHLVLKYKQVKTKPGEDALKAINTRLGTYAVDFDPRNQGAADNIRLAAQLINNQLVKPGEVFSLNQALGARTEERGFKWAPVVVNDQLLAAYGGGVYALGGSLYNAVLQAGLPVTMRLPDYKPVDYVLPGRYAPVDENQIDFRFANNQKYPLLIGCTVQDSRLLVSIYGHKEGNKNTMIKTETERNLTEPGSSYQVNPGLSPSRVQVLNPGRVGYKTKVYEVTLVNGHPAGRKLISSREVKPQKAVVLVGNLLPQEGK